MFPSQNDDGGLQYWQTAGSEQQYREWVAEYERTEKQMGLIVKATGEQREFAQAPTGSHVGRCFRLIDLGTQRSEYLGKPKVRSQVFISWELPTELMDTEEGEKPFVVSRFMTKSLGEKSNMLPFLEAWRGRTFTKQELDGFNLEKVLGAPGLVTVIHNKNGKTEVANCIALPKGMICPPPVNAKQLFFFPEHPIAEHLKDWDPKAFEAVPEGIRKICMQSDEYKEITALLVEHKKASAMGAVMDMPDDNLDDDIPF